MYWHGYKKIKLYKSYNNLLSKIIFTKYKIKEMINNIKKAILKDLYIILNNNIYFIKHIKLCCIFKLKQIMLSNKH
jgi:hypothetical protein